MSWWKIASSSAPPPLEPTPSCPPSLSAESRLETYVRRNSPRLDGTDLFRVSFTLVMGKAIFWDISGDLLRFCERTNQLVGVKYLCSGFFLTSGT